MVEPETDNINAEELIEETMMNDEGFINEFIDDDPTVGHIVEHTNIESFYPVEVAVSVAVAVRVGVAVPLM